jgi:hypothetical protein
MWQFLAAISAPSETSPVQKLDRSDVVQ